VVGVLFHHGFDIRLVARLAGEDEGRDQRHLHVGEGGVGTAHGARPQPGNHRELLPDQRHQVRAVGCQLRGDGDRRVQVPDPPLRLFPHPLTVIPHVGRQALHAMPGVQIKPLAILRIDRQAVAEARRNLDHCLIDRHRHRVEVAGVGFETEPLRFERDGAAAGKRVVEAWERGHPARMDRFNNLVV
jgi:hypothetical protein